jgi:ABC-2 type transport system permease protein
MRRALLGSTQLQSPLSSWDHWHLGLALIASTLFLCLVAHLVFRWSELRAWRLGRYDQVTGY